MPQYDWECQTDGCRERVTVICKVAEKPDTMPCPKCGALCERVYHAPGTIFKGTGWTPKFSPIGRG